MASITEKIYLDISIIPKGEPPLLSSEEIKAIEERWSANRLLLSEKETPKIMVAQAQREADIKWYEGEGK